MWMVGYNEGGDQLNMVVDHPFSGRKLRPLMPRPMTSPNNASTTTTPCLSRIHGNDFFSQYHHHLSTVGEQNKRDNQFNAPTPVVVSSRWNPTPEQLRALEELYRRGTRTPSAEQIQHITAQLRRFGKIEGKNVFYWFQNHKARERQKRRRQMESASDHHQGHNHNQHRDFDVLEQKDLAASRTVVEVEQTKNWAPSTNCSTLAEESVSIQRAAKAGGAECRPDGWLQFDEGELQQRRNFMERNATWHMMHQSPCPAPPAPVTHLINTPPNNAIMATTTTVATRTMDPKLIKNHDLSFFISTQTENGTGDEDDDNNCVESQTTLQLFPLRSGGDDGSSDDNINDKETDISASAVNANLTPSQFFEFLPLKN